MKGKFYIFDSDALKNFHKRVFFSISVFFFVFIIALYRIVDVMIIDNEVKIITKFNEIEKRGNIYDRNGTLLSTSIKTYSLGAKPFELKNKKKLSKQLSLITLLDEKKIFKLLNQKKSYVPIKRDISPRERQKIINLGEIGLTTKKSTKRIYPYQNIASHALGYVDTESIGLSGIERGMNEELSNGEDVYLSLDINLQAAIGEELKKSINKFSAKSGAVLVMKISNGEIISMNSFPDFDPNNNKTFKKENLFNNLTQGNYEMGSTFKPITVSIGIDEKIIDLDMKFDVSKPINGKIHDFHPFNGSLGVKEIIVKSSNIGAAKIAKLIGKEKQKHFFNKIGFNEKINFEIKEVANPLGNKNNWGEIETMTIGYGHGFAITPLHLVTAYASLSNSGIKIKPTIIKSNNLVDVNKNNYAIVKKETSLTFLKLLRAVVLETEYTGPRVKINGYEIGGKTGTSELIDKNGRYQSGANLASFIGVFPISKPMYVVLALIEHPKKIKEENYNVTGATVAAPLVKKVIANMIKILSIPQINNEEILNADTRIEHNKFNATF